jgi:hypothetical protein
MSAPPATITWEAPAECPDAASFSAGVQRQTGATLATSDEGIAVVCSIRGDRGHYEGTFSVVRDGEASAPRTVHSDDCAELASTLELMVALALERSEAAPPAPPVTSAAVISPDVQASERPVVANADRRWVVGASMDVRALGVVVPSAGAFAEWHRGRATFRGSARFAWASSDVKAAASYRWLLGDVDGCALSVRVERLELQPCLRLEGGALSASSSAGLDGPVNAVRPWLAAGALGRAQLRVGWLSLEAEAGAGLPLVRDTFVFEPRVVSYQAPVAFVWAGAGAGVHFW